MENAKTNRESATKVRRETSPQKGTHTQRKRHTDNTYTDRGTETLARKHTDREVHRPTHTQTHRHTDT